MVHIDVVVLRIAHHDVVAFHADFGEASVFQCENCSQEKRVNQVTVIVEQLQLYSETPCQFALYDTEALSVRGSRLLEHLVNKATYLDAHLLQRRRLLVELCRMQQGSKLNCDL